MADTVVATYRVRSGQVEAFLELLEQHFPTLTALDLVTSDPPVVYVGEERGGGPIVFEIFTWKDSEAPGAAHAAPEIGKLWGAMGDLVEDRPTGPKFDFPHVERHTLRGL